MRDTIDDMDGLLNPIPSASRPHAREQHGNRLRGRQERKPERDRRNRGGNQAAFAHHGDDAPDQQALHEREHRADEREHVPDVRAREAEPALAEQRKRRFETRERRADDEVEHEEQQQPRLRERAAKQLEAPSRGRASPASPAATPAAGTTPPRNSRGTGPTRHHIGADGPRCVEDAAERRPEDEPEAKRRSDHPHAARAVLRGRDIGDVGLRGWDVRAGDAADNARHERSGTASRRARAPDTRGTSRAVQSG